MKYIEVASLHDAAAVQTPLESKKPIETKEFQRSNIKLNRKQEV
jgi:hypothetical protein